MALQAKYKELIDLANKDVSGVQISEKNGALYVNGSSNAVTKAKLWSLYNKIDPDFSSGDLVLNITAPELLPGTKLKVITESTNLNIRKGPSTTDAIVGKAAHHEVVTLVNQTNDQWWEIKTKDGEQGFAFTQYLAEA
ncbi:MAG: SH3 domain-containing protein [Cytophagaceae bacterium]|nr:SH3 domain-containing protein [Cytophagaceae bacterium]